MERKSVVRGDMTSAAAAGGASSASRGGGGGFLGTGRGCDGVDVDIRLPLFSLLLSFLLDSRRECDEPSRELCLLLDFGDVDVVDVEDFPCLRRLFDEGLSSSAGGGGGGGTSSSGICTNV